MTEQEQETVDAAILLADALHRVEIHKGTLKHYAELQCAADDVLRALQLLAWPRTDVALTRHL